VSGDRGYASVPERITWTNGFRCATDKIVLGALSCFANFETGKGARVRLKKLVARAELKKRTVQRGLHRLEADGWIVAVRRQHKGATSWDIVIEKLAPHWMVPKLVGGVMPSFPQGDPILNVTSGAQLNVTSGAQHPLLNVTGGAQEAILDVTSGAQLNVTSGAQIPCTERTPVQQIGSPVERNPSAPGAGAPGSRGTDDDEREEPGVRVTTLGCAGELLPPWEVFNRAQQSQTRNADERQNGDHPPNDVVGDLEGHRSDHPAAPGAGLSLRQGPDLPGAESDQRPRAPVGPTQQTFGPIDVSPTDEQHRRFMEDLRSRIRLPTSSPVEQTKERTSG
jgi:hypothetical protein